MYRVMLRSAIWLAVIVLAVSKAPARDVGQWANVDPAQRQWFNGLMQPDNPGFIMLRGGGCVLGRQL